MFSSLSASNCRWRQHYGCIKPRKPALDLFESLLDPSEHLLCRERSDISCHPTLMGAPVPSVGVPHGDGAQDDDNLRHGWAHLACWLTNIHYCQISLDWNNCHLKPEWLSIRCFFCCHWICFQQQHLESCDGPTVQIHDFYFSEGFFFFSRLTYVGLWRK